MLRFLAPVIWVGVRRIGTLTRNGFRLVLRRKNHKTRQGPLVSDYLNETRQVVSRDERRQAISCDEPRQANSCDEPRQAISWDETRHIISRDGTRQAIYFRDVSLSYISRYLTRTQKGRCGKRKLITLGHGTYILSNRYLCRYYY